MNALQTVHIHASQCIGILIASTTTEAAVIRANTKSLRIRRLSSTSMYGEQVTHQRAYAATYPEETFRFCRVLPNDDHLYRGGVHESIRITPN